MFSLRRNDRTAEAKAPLKPAIYEPPGVPAPTAAGATTPDSLLTLPRDTPPRPPGAARSEAPTPAVAAEPSAATIPPPSPQPQAAGSKLSIGVNIKLKGVEISDCDVMVIEGHVEATVHSHVMEIAKPGTLKGTAMIDVAEIHGDFSGELTARTRLVVHATGRVSGTIRYGKLIVAEGGELNGDGKRLDAADTSTQPPREAAPSAPFTLGTADERGVR
jgi:cytoskeletal protein CcmA (bactofilin family)